MTATDINDVTSEAGVVASAALQPELVFYSEQLTPHHFSNEQNAYLYYSICELAKRGVSQVDAYNITNILNAKAATREKTSLLTVPAINDFLDAAHTIARSTVEEYKMLVDNVLDAAFRRETYSKLAECQSYCLNYTQQDIQQKIYSTLDNVMLEYSTVTEVRQYKDVVDELWAEIESRQDGNFAGMPFKFPALNQYASIEPGELFIFAA